MRSIIIKSGTVAVISALASVILAALIMGSQGARLSETGLLMSTLCPLLVAWPASAWSFVQKRSIAYAHEEVARAHDELARAHAELAEAHARLAERASRDAMTGLLNRETFLSTVRSQNASGVTGVLLIIDADHFKSINDNYGHATGAAALVEIAGAIKRKADRGSIPGRIGGEEFAVFLPGADLSSASSTAEAIRREVAAVRMTAPSHEALKLSVSIGGAELGAEIGMAQALQLADSRLYTAKRTGRDTIVVPRITVPAAA